MKKATAVVLCSVILLMLGIAAGDKKSPTKFSKEAESKQPPLQDNRQDFLRNNQQNNDPWGITRSSIEGSKIEPFFIQRGPVRKPIADDLDTRIQNAFERLRNEINRNGDIAAARASLNNLISQLPREERNAITKAAISKGTEVVGSLRSVEDWSDISLGAVDPSRPIGSIASSSHDINRPRDENLNQRHRRHDETWPNAAVDRTAKRQSEATSKANASLSNKTIADSPIPEINSLPIAPISHEMESSESAPPPVLIPAGDILKAEGDPLPSLPPMDPLQIQINELSELRKTTELNGGDVAAIDAQLNALIARGDRATLDDNGGTTFYSSHGPISVPNWSCANGSITVSGLGTTILDVEVQVDTLTYAYNISLVDIYLISPSGDTCTLSTGNGGTGRYYYNTRFDDDAATSITTGTSPFTGSYRPEEPLAVFQGENPNGEWKMRVCQNEDNACYLRRWRIQILASTPGDTCENAMTMYVPGVHVGNTCGASDDYYAACPFTVTGGVDVVYRYMPESTQNVSFSLCRSSFDTKLMIYDGTCNGAPIACNDDANPCPGATGPFRSRVECFRLLAWHTYYIVVDGYSSSACGTYYLETGFCPSCDVQDQPSDVIECTEIPDSSHARLDCNGGPNNVPYGGTALYGAISCGQTITGDGFTYINSGLTFRDTDWYRFTLNQADSLLITYTGEFETTIYILDSATVNVQYLFFASMCETVVDTVPNLAAGHYILWVGPRYFLGVPIPADYRVTLNCFSTLGRDCNEPINLQDIATLGNRTTCGRINNYSNTCLGSYDNGEDALFRWTVSEPGDYVIWLNPRSTDYSGILIDDQCPPSATGCLGINANSSSLPHGINCLYLDAGTYYIMVDTWPEPYCIPSFDLMTGYCYPNCVTSQPGDIEECAETPDTSHSRVDCNGGIGNYYYGGVRSWGAVSSGQSVYGRCFTFAGGSGSPRRDADYYLFTLTERSYVSLRGKAEFPAFMGISDTALNHTIVTDYSLESCDSFFVQTVLDPGTYSANVSPFDNVGLPLEKHYRFTFETEPWESFPGSDCSDPVVQQGAGILINETTCLNYNDYDNTCLGDADEGEDRIYRFEPPGYGNWTIWLDPHGTPTTSIATDTTCPPDFLCHTSSTGNLIGTPHGLFINLDGPRYIVVDQYLDLIDNCIPTYDLFFQENCVSFYAEDVRECSELYWDSTHAFNDCNGGCYNEYAGGVARYGSVSSGDTLVGGLIQYWYDGFRNTDMDQFLFTITQPETVRVAAKCDVPFEIGIMDTNYCDYRSLVDWTQTLSYCDSLFITVPCLAPGTYAIYVTAAAGTIFAPASYRLSFQISSAPCPYMQGRDCANNIYMSGAYTLISQSTCPMQDDYDGTCLGSYDGGADIIYEWELQFAGDYYLWVDPHESIYTGLLLDDECPPSADNCIAIAYNSDAVPYGTDCMHLEAGTYYIMVDSWPYPYCIPQFDLSIGPCDSCITNQPGDTMECAESADSSNAANDCNGGCNNDDVGGINQFATISDGETVCGRAFTYIRNGLNYRDTDWYTFNLSQPETVHVTVATEFSAMVAIIDTIGNCNNVQLVATAFTEPCDTTIMHIDSLGAGQHFLWIGPYSYGGVPHERDYRLTFDAIPHSLGNDCATAMEIADEVTLTGLTTCGKLNDYDSTCLEGYDDGEDMVFAWTVTTGGMYTVWLNPRGSLASGVAIDDQCPPSYDNCLARSESWAEVEHGVCVTMDPGTYYIIVDTYPFVPCLPEFDLTITASEVPFNDLCENAIYLNVPGTTYGSTKCATVDVTPDCWEDPPYYPGVWYEITGTGTTITADVCNSGVQWNNRIGIYTCSCDSLVCVAAESDLCSDTSFLRPVSWCSRLGETYWILVHGLWGSTGDFRLDVYDDQIACPFGLRCPCADLTLTAPGQIADSTLGADNSCWSSSSPDKVVQVEIPSAGYWNFSLCGSDFDTYLLIGSDCCQFDVGSANDYFCNGEYGAQSVLCVYLPAAGYYYATIEGLGGAASEAGHFMLDVQPDDGFIPAQVTGVNATEDQCQVVVITWDDVVGEDGYAVWTDVGYWYVVPADCTQQIDFQINPGDGHWYTVYAIAACGEGPVSTADYGMAWRVVDAVQNLSATDTVCDSIYLTWNDVNDEDEYRIYRGGILVGSAGTDTTHFTDYPESGTYNYTVTAYNDICGEGPTSISDLGTRLPMPGFVANPTASSNFCDRIELSWTDAEHETAYYIDRDAVTLDTILPANTTSFTDCTAVPGITHEYSVISSNACGAQGVSALGARVPTPAQVSAVTASDTICDYVRITWDDAQGETGYRVARNGTTIATGIDADITTYHDADAVAGIVYEYVVCAYNIGCSGPWSVPDSGQRRTPPLSAPIPFIPDSCQAYHVCWTDVADAEGYRLYRNGILIDSVPSGILCFTDSTIPQPSQFSVAAYNACGEGPISPPILIGFPVLPSINSLTATDGLCDSIYLSWTVAGAADSCAVYRNAVPLGWTSAAVYTDRTAMPFTVCSYTIAGQNACGMGPLSAPNNGSMSDNPAQVLGVTATQNRCDSIIVTWTDVLHETHYRIIVDGMPVDSVPVNRTRFAHAPAAGTHQYTVQAVNQCGAGAASSTAEGIRLIAPGIPASIAASDNLCGSVTIWWGDATGDIDSYRFYRNGVFIGSALPAAESYVDSPVTGSFSYTVTAYSSECGEGGPSTPDSGTGHGVPSTPGNLQAITPVTCDSIRLTWNAAVGEVSQYIINRDGQPIDSTVQTHYTDHYLADNHEHDYMVKAYNPFCGFGPITDPVFGYVLTLMEVTTEMPDTVPSGQWLVLDVQYCSNTDSARMYLALNNGPYQYQRTFLPSARDSVFFEPVSNHTPNCHIMGLIYRDSRMDSLVLPSFVLAAANAADIQLSGIPADYFLARNYPNPFNPSTTIRFGVPVASEISIDIYDILGRHVASLLNTMVPPGVHTLIWDCSSCPSGMYVVRMQAGQRTFLNKMLLMK